MGGFHGGSFRQMKCKNQHNTPTPCPQAFIRSGPINGGVLPTIVDSLEAILQISPDD